LALPPMAASKLGSRCLVHISCFSTLGERARPIDSIMNLVLTVDLIGVL
jgi:hypothetical protein